MEGGGDRGGTYGDGDIGNVGPLPPATAIMVPGREGVDHGLVGEGGVVPDGLHNGDGSSSLQERGHSVTTT